MASKHNSRRARSSSSSSRRPRRYGADAKRRRRQRSSSTEFERRRPPSSSSSDSSSSRRGAKKFRPKKHSASPGKPAPKAAGERMPFSASAKHPAHATPKSASKSKTDAEKAEKVSAKDPKVDPKAKPAAEGATAATPGIKKFDLGAFAELQKKLEEDRGRIELTVIKAKREHEENRETAEKHAQREKEYYHGELGMPCGPQNRFLLEAELGMGVFSTVYRGKDMGTQGKEYAIKFIRNNAMCRRATEKEVKLMRVLRNKASVQDPEGARCLMGLAGIEMFEQNGHLAVVLQLMKMDLRSGMRKYGQGFGLPPAFVHSFSKDIFLALRALRSIKVVHTDLKPDNLLIALDKFSVRLSDFGSAMDNDQAQQVITDSLQPMYYRAPEVILGQPYSTQIDMWSAGCTLFEMATDQMLCRGESNNGMIHCMLKVRGAFSKKFATTGKFATNHFSESGDFLLKDKGNSTVETIAMSEFAKPSPSIHRMLEDALAKQPVADGLKGEAKAKVDAKNKASMRQLADLICKCCEVDPAERIKPNDALAHPFVPKAKDAK